MARFAFLAPLFENIKSADKKIIAACVAISAAIIYLFLFYNIGISPRLSDLSAVNAEIRANKRILEIKEKNYASMHENTDALARLSEKTDEVKSGPVLMSDLPDALINVTRIMEIHNINENEFAIQPAIRYDGGVVRQPLAVSGTASYGDVYAFLYALIIDENAYGIDRMTLSGTDGGGDVFIKLNLYITALDAGIRDVREDTVTSAYNAGINPFGYGDK